MVQEAEEGTAREKLVGEPNGVLTIVVTTELEAEPVMDRVVIRESQDQVRPCLRVLQLHKMCKLLIKLRNIFTIFLLKY